MFIMRKILIIFALLVTVIACKDKDKVKASTPKSVASEQDKAKEENPIKMLHPEIIREFPHDIKAYTQGLFYRDGYLFESTGQYGESSLRKIDLQTGAVLKQIDLEDKYFGEGICYADQNIYMLTWKNHKGFVFDYKTFEKKSEFSYYTEGWGLETKGEHLIMSDGSNYLRFIKKSDFSETNTLAIKYHDSSLNLLNELELVGDTLYANIYMYDAIGKIDINSGNTLDVIDCSALRKQLGDIDASEAFNGIAYIPETQTFIVTGKYWDKYFEVRFVKQ